MKPTNHPEELNNFVLFKTADGKVNIDVYFHDDTLWLTQKLIAELFQKDRSVITKHLKKIFEEGELNERVVSAKFAQTTQHGAMEGKTQQKDVLYYNLRAIIAVGYRVNSHRATEFRKWATEILHEYIIKGFALDDERLKQNKHFGQDYFDELLERIREIRLSERRLYQKITDIYALSADYDRNDETTQQFFATVQNKMHWDIQGKTDSLESNKSFFQKNVILFGKLRSYFHQVVFSPISGVCSTDILVVRPKKENLLPFCLFWFFSKEVVEHSDLGSGGTRMPRTNWEIIGRYKIPQPNVEKIIDFNSITRPSLENMFQSIKQIRTLENLRDTLLPKLMSGEVRVEV